MTFAIIETGGKQYKVTPGQKIRVEKIDGEVGKKFEFDKVLLLAEKDVEVGTPYLKTGVEGRVLLHSRSDKKIVFRYHSKTRYRKFKTHRQPFTEVEIVKIK